jgi:hypothetical protein
VAHRPGPLLELLILLKLQTLALTYACCVVLKAKGTVVVQVKCVNQCKGTYSACPYPCQPTIHHASTSLGTLGFRVLEVLLLSHQVLEHCKHMYRPLLPSVLVLELHAIVRHLQIVARDHECHVMSLFTSYSQLCTHRPNSDSHRLVTRGPGGSD